MNLPRNLEELVARNFEFHLPQMESTILRSHLHASTNPAYREVLKNVVDSLIGCEKISLLASQKAAIFDTNAVLQYQVLEN